MLEITLCIVNKERVIYYITLVYRDGSFTIVISLCKVNINNFKVILKLVYSFEDYLYIKEDELIIKQST